MTNAPQHHHPADDLILAAAEAHRAEHGHTVLVLQGHGWLCEVCDDDVDEVLADFYGADGPCDHDGAHEPIRGQALTCERCGVRI